MQEDTKSQISLFSHLPTNHQKLLGALLAILLLLITYSSFVALSKIRSPEPDTSHESEALNTTLEPSETIPAPPQDSRLMLEVKNGDTLSSLFKQAGFGPELVDDIIRSSQDTKVLRSLFPGNRLAFAIDSQNALVSLEVFKSPLESFKFSKQQDGEFDYQHQVLTPEIKLVVREAVITESLWAAAQKGGIPIAMNMQLGTTIFGGVIDFILDIREGDTFKVLFEEKYLDGNKIGFGNILAAEFVNQGKHFTAMRYEDPQGHVNFFNPKGESMHKAFLLNPVDFTRISSGFSLSRKHPILNTIRAHKGTDYAAPRGTPVVATSDGRITYVGTNSSFGKLVVIQHSASFTTKYAHLNDFAKGIKLGTRVRQGEKIGFVGATGAATGPHLHYEFLMDGIQRDSRKIYDKLPQADALDKKEFSDFQKQTNQYLSMLQGENKRGTIANTTTKTKSAVLLQ
jgi:murein DD-endopeptidase MepM/ murein hydrolase activator NlpD